METIENSDLKERTKLFALRCIKLALVLPKSKLGNHISGQLIRSSTSVASNYRAAKLAQSKAAFIAKLSIVIEEADESAFWLEVIIDTKQMAEDKVLALYDEANELTAIFAASRITATKGKNR